MSDVNFQIAQRIRAARIQRNLTQQDLARKFNKTSAAISDLERGKSQITAADLIVFSELLNKPIEYFFGEDFSDNEIQDIIALMRRLPPEMRKEQLPMMMSFLQMVEIAHNMQNTEDEEVKQDAIKEFYENFLPFYGTVESMMNQATEAKKNIESLLK